MNELSWFDLDQRLLHFGHERRDIAGEIGTDLFFVFHSCLLWSFLGRFGGRRNNKLSLPLAYYSFHNG